MHLFRIASEFKWQGYARRTSHYPLHTSPNGYLRDILLTITSNLTGLIESNLSTNPIRMLARTNRLQIACMYVHLKSC